MKFSNVNMPSLSDSRSWKLIRSLRKRVATIALAGALSVSGSVSTVEAASTQTGSTVLYQDDEYYIAPDGSLWLNQEIYENSKKSDVSITKVVDSSSGKSLAQVPEKFYEDDLYDYYFGVYKSNWITVYYSDGTTKNIKQALKDGDLPVDDLVRKYDIGFSRQAREIKTIVGVVDNSMGMSLPQKLEKVYADSSYDYYFNVEKSSLVTVYYSDGTTKNIKQALNNRDLTVEDLQNKYNISTIKVSNTKPAIISVSDTSVGMSLPNVSEKFYEDDTYDYYFSTQKSSLVLVYYSNGNRKNIRQALQNGDLTIYDLQNKYGISVIKVSKWKATIVSVVDASSGVNVSNVPEKFYTDGTYDYYFSSQKSSLITVYYSDGTRKNIKQALESKDLTINDLLNKYGISYSKVNKNVKATIVGVSDTSTGLSLPESLEKFYEDSVYDYYFNVEKSSWVTVYYSDGTAKNIKQALHDGDLTINDLQNKYGISFMKILKYVKATIIGVSDTSVGLSLPQSLEKFYNDNVYDYYFNVQKSSLITVHYSDGTTKNIKQALNDKDLTINDLQSKYNVSFKKVRRSAKTTIVGVIDASLGLSLPKVSEKFYEDDVYNYYFDVQKSSLITVYYSNETTKNIKQALADGDLTIKELKTKYGISFNKAKTNKVRITKIVDGSNKPGVSLVRGEEIVYEDASYVYIFDCIKSPFITVKYSDGKKKNIRQALIDGDLTIEQLQNKYGIFVRKEKKQMEQLPEYKPEELYKAPDGTYWKSYEEYMEFIQSQKTSDAKEVNEDGYAYTYTMRRI